MAWFNPPLYKHGNKKCLNWGHSSGWWGWPGRSWAWAKWNCPNCQSVLGIDLGRRAVQAIAVGLPYALVLSLGNVHKWPGWAGISFFAGWVVLFLLAWWWFDSVVLRRPAEQASGVS